MPRLLTIIFVATALTVPPAVSQTYPQEGTQTMSQGPLARTVPVPGASIHIEQTGSGPVLLLLPGGAQDAGVFSGLAQALAGQFTVVALDPRCNSRSPCDDIASDLSVDQHADDAAAVIAAFAGGPVLVFGTSGSAQVGLNLAARYPHLVHTLVAHEPPSMMLMDDPSPHLAADKALYELYQRDGVEAAMAKFMAENGLDGRDAPPPEMSAEDLETFGRMSGNFEYWLAHGMLPLSQYRADVGKLKGGAPKIVVGLGAGSEGHPIYEMGAALAKALELSPVIFPGDHMGFAMEPEAFAHTLQAALKLK